MITEGKIKQIQDDVKRLAANDKLSVISAVSGIPVARLKAIAAGATPTLMEVTSIDVLR